MPVGSFPLGAGPFGTMDLLGNMLEWVSDRPNALVYARWARESSTALPIIDPTSDEEPMSPPVIAVLPGQRVMRGEGALNVALPTWEYGGYDSDVSRISATDAAYSGARCAWDAPPSSP